MCWVGLAPHCQHPSEGQQPSRGLIEVDDHRSVVGRHLALAGLAVDVGVGDLQARAGQHVVDPHAQVLGEHPGPVVPVGEGPVVLAGPGHHVDQTPVDQGLEGCPLGRRDVGGADVGRDVEHVVVGAGHVEVAHDHQWSGRVMIVERAPQRRVPLQLVGELRIVHGPAVGHVHTDHAQRAAVRADIARLAQTRQPAGHRNQTDPGQQRHPVPPAVAHRQHLIAQPLDLRRGEGLVRDLGLLQRHHVRRSGLQPVDQPRQPADDRVDVPGGDAHGAKPPITRRPVTR